MAELMADPPFPRGRTAGVTATQGGSFIGVVKYFLDTNPQQPISRYSNRLVKCIAVRNTSGAAILPKQVVKLKAAALHNEVDGTADNAAGLVLAVADEYLPAAGCPANDIFWVVVHGPATVSKTAPAISAGAAVGPSATAGSAAAGSGLGLALDAAALNSTEMRVQLTLTHS